MTPDDRSVPGPDSSSPGGSGPDVERVHPQVAPAPRARAAEAGPVVAGPARPPADPIDPADPGGSAATDALDIPMLTDVVRVSRYAASELPASLDQPDWSDLSRRIEDNVMQRLLRRTESMLDGPLQQALDLVLERHLHAMHRDLSDAMSRILRELVARAVADELARVHAEIAGRESSRPEAAGPRSVAPRAAPGGPDLASPGAPGPERVNVQLPASLRRNT